MAEAKTTKAPAKKAESPLQGKFKKVVEEIKKFRPGDKEYRDLNARLMAIITQAKAQGVRLEK